MIEKKQNHSVYRNKTGGTHQDADSDCVPTGNLFSLFLGFLLFFFYVSVVVAIC